MSFRLGLVGLCTSHPRRWVPIIRDLSATDGLDIEVLAAWDSAEVQTPGCARTFCEEYQIPHAVSRLEDMLPLVDGVIVHTANWDRHVSQAQPFVEAGKAVLIDKPMAGNLRDARLLLDWAAKGRTISGGSSLRFAAEIKRYLAQPIEERGELHTVMGGCGTDAFFYGIHAYSMLCGLMGPGLHSVEYLDTTRQTLLKLNWRDGKAGILLIGEANKLPFYLTAVSTTGVAQIQIDPAGIYRSFLKACLPYLCGRAGVPPIPMRDLIEPELAALAARVSRHQGGGKVLLEDLSEQDPGYDGAAFAASYRKQIIH